MVANIGKMAFVGDDPWWLKNSPDRGVNLGKSNVTAAEMFSACGADFEVEAQPIYTLLHEATRREIPDLRAVVRQDTGAVLGVVSNRYEVIQNIHAFHFFDEVVGSGQAIYHTAGYLGDGERVWILAKLPETYKVAGWDTIQNYLAMFNGHDGVTAFTFMSTPIRVVCQNTYNIAFSGFQHGAIGNFRLKHFTGINKRMNVDDARTALGIAKEGFEHLTVVADVMAQTRMKDEEFQGFLQRLFPIPHQLLLDAPKTPTLLLPEPSRDSLMPEFQIVFKKRDIVDALYRNGKGNSGQTKWDAMNAVTEFTDYMMGHASKRTNNLLFGTGRALKQQAWGLLQK